MNAKNCYPVLNQAQNLYFMPVVEPAPHLNFNHNRTPWIFRQGGVQEERLNLVRLLEFLKEELGKRGTFSDLVEIQFE